ncbi:hypothetical protein MHYP_G00295920 [Metynnis hypsauchen]
MFEYHSSLTGDSNVWAVMVNNMKAEPVSVSNGSIAMRTELFGESSRLTAFCCSGVAIQSAMMTLQSMKPDPYSGHGGRAGVTEHAHNSSLTFIGRDTE